MPPALRDRMEVLMPHGYTLDEKIKIANRFLIPRQREAHGIKAKQIKFTNSAVKQIITGYTREAGLRNLEHAPEARKQAILADRLVISKTDLADTKDTDKLITKLKERIDWKVQLNVSNAFSGDSLIPINTQPDGTPAAYRIAPSRTFKLTNTFSF